MLVQYASALKEKRKKKVLISSKSATILYNLKRTYIRITTGWLPGKPAFKYVIPLNRQCPLNACYSAGGSVDC